jgi:glycosyltransferase involved in cell wall biosynthesis
MTVDSEIGDLSWGTKANMPATSAAQLSVLVPIYNEADNIAELCERLFTVLNALAVKFEVIAVNDGSTDQSLERLRDEAGRHPELKIINFRRNYGQTAALMAAIDHASGKIFVAIDADLQNDPNDIPRLLALIDEGYDLVSGWRQYRMDSPVSRNFVSRMANKLISYISGVHLNDYGCTLKAYRRDVIEGVRLYGEMHRFMPIYANMMGAKVIEIPVAHYPRRHGESKYGFERVIKVVLDLMVVRFLDRYFVKPMYIFGGFGIVVLLISAFSFLVMVYLKIVDGVSMIRTPLPLITAFTFLVGFVAILMGLIAEMMVRTYFESQNRAPYVVRELINFDVKSTVQRSTRAPQRS